MRIGTLGSAKLGRGYSSGLVSDELCDQATTCVTLFLRFALDCHAAARYRHSPCDGKPP